MRLLTLPVTIARVPFEFGFEVVKRVAGFAYGVVAPGEEEDRVDFAKRTEPAPAGNGRGPEAEVAAPAEPAAPEVAPGQPLRDEAPPAAAASAEPAEHEPAHVSEEPELVAEVAEEGAEEGAGPEIEIDEPWPGYDRMNASDISDRLVAEGAEAAAAVRLYEASRKGRASVLEAASRNLRD
jgi:hypothetical protein